MFLSFHQEFHLVWSELNDRSCFFPIYFSLVPKMTLGMQINLSNEALVTAIDPYQLCFQYHSTKSAFT